MNFTKVNTSHRILKYITLLRPTTNNLVKGQELFDCLARTKENADMEENGTS
jgi:hypothetical protein